MTLTTFMPREPQIAPPRILAVPTLREPGTGTLRGDPPETSDGLSSFLDGVEELAPGTLEREDMPVLALQFA
jgi:hypothetical protein